MLNRRSDIEGFPEPSQQEAINKVIMQESPIQVQESFSCHSKRFPANNQMHGSTSICKLAAGSD